MEVLYSELLSGKEVLCGHRIRLLSADGRVLLRQHGYPWMKVPEQCQEPDSIRGYLRSVPSHRSPVHVRHDVLRWTKSYQPA